MSEESDLSELVGLLAPGQVLTSPEDLRVYGFDGTPILKGKAGAVVFPTTTEDVQKVVNWCRGHGRPVVSRGSGTGLSGGSVPMAGAVVICLVRMDRIETIDTENLTLLAQTGTLTKTIDDAAAAAGLFYPPDPSSMKISTIGGNVANNSGGLRGLKYGVTRDYVMAVEVVTADGEIHWLGNQCVKDVAGYNLKDLFIGSEGTLGVITRVLLKLVPRPEARRTLLATFASMETAATTVSAIIAAKVIPCTLEFLDKTTIRCVEDFAHVGLPTECAALLFMETDGHPAQVEDEAEAMQKIAEANGALEVRTAADVEEANRLATARRSAFAALARIRPTTILEDVTVPRSRLAEMVAAVEASAQRHKVQVATFGHFGDGNLHPTFLTDERDTEEMERVELAMSEIFDKAIELGGTITGEHGVGLAKKPYLERQFGASEMGLLRKVKAALDPEGILNPGKIFD